MSGPYAIHWPAAAARFLALRLLPGDDLRAVLEETFAGEPEEAGFVVACVGSLSYARLRPAGRDDPQEFSGDMEIVALSGTLAPEGAHLHLAVSDADCDVRGGHLLTGSLVRTTTELVIGLAPVRFRRGNDPVTGFSELFFG